MISYDFSSVKLHALIPGILAGIATTHQGEAWMKSASGYTFILWETDEKDDDVFGHTICQEG